MNIRPATRDDRDAIVALNCAAQDRHSEIRPAFFKSVSEAAIAATLADTLSKEQCHCCVVEVADNVVGYLLAEQIHREETAFIKAQDYLLIHQVAVAPDHQRNGIATALLQHAEALAAQLGLSRIEIDSYTANRAATTLYAREGFQTFREKMEKDIRA